MAKLKVGQKVKIKRIYFGVKSYTEHIITERVKGEQAGNRVHIDCGIVMGIVRYPTRYKIETGEIMERKKMILI